MVELFDTLLLLLVVMVQRRRRRLRPIDGVVPPCLVGDKLSVVVAHRHVVLLGDVAVQRLVIVSQSATTDGAVVADVGQNDRHHLLHPLAATVNLPYVVGDLSLFVARSLKDTFP